MAGVDPLSLAVAGGGAGLNIMAQQEQADEKRAILNRQLAANSATAKNVQGQVIGEAQNLSPAARQAALDAATTKTADSTAADIAGAGGPLVDTAGDAGNVSKDFITAKADRAVSEGTRLTELGRALAKVRAPGIVTTNDGYRQGNLSSNISNVLGANANMANANAQDAQAVQLPTYGALGSIASALGTAYAGGQLAKGAGAASIVPSATNTAGLTPGNFARFDRGQINW